MCDCIYCRQEPDYPREQADKEITMTDNSIRDVLHRHFGTHVNEDEEEIVQALERGQAAIYQIERTIAQLEEGDTISGYALPGRVYDVIESVLAQLKAYLGDT